MPHFKAPAAIDRPPRHWASVQTQEKFLSSSFYPEKNTGLIKQALPQIMLFTALVILITSGGDIGVSVSMTVFTKNARYIP
ncbi:MAG: hypothetical protein V3S09_04440, partial [Candidatus Bathyarchaeia archaeon]